MKATAIQTPHIFYTDNRIVLTSISHGEAIPQFDHIHLRNQFRDILVMRERKPKHLIFVGFGWE